MYNPDSQGGKESRHHVRNQDRIADSGLLLNSLQNGCSVCQLWYCFGGHKTGGLHSLQASGGQQVDELNLCLRRYLYVKTYRPV